MKKTLILLTSVGLICAGCSPLPDRERAAAVAIKKFWPDATCIPNGSYTMVVLHNQKYYLIRWDAEDEGDLSNIKMYAPTEVILTNILENVK